MFKIEVLKNNIQKEYFYEIINQFFFKFDENTIKDLIEKPLALLSPKRQRKMKQKYEEETENFEPKPFKKRK